MIDDDIKLLRAAVNVQSLVVALQSVVFLAVLYVIISHRPSGEPGGVEVSQEASPTITNQVGGGLEEIEARAERRGYFTRAEFAEIVGVSTRTIDRRIEAGLVDPVPVKDESGAVRIDLEACLVSVPTLARQNDDRK